MTMREWWLTQSPSLHLGDAKCKPIIFAGIRVFLDDGFRKRLSLWRYIKANISEFLCRRVEAETGREHGPCWEIKIEQGTLKKLRTNWAGWCECREREREGVVGWKRLECISKWMMMLMLMRCVGLVRWSVVIKSFTSSKAPTWWPSGWKFYSPPSDSDLSKTSQIVEFPTGFAHTVLYLKPCRVLTTFGLLITSQLSPNPILACPVKAVSHSTQKSCKLQVIPLAKEKGRDYIARFWSTSTKCDNFDRSWHTLVWDRVNLLSHTQAFMSRVLLCGTRGSL